MIEATEEDPTGLRDGDPPARPRGRDHDPLRRRVRALDRRGRGRDRERPVERLVLLRQRDRVVDRRARRSRCAPATGSGGTTATGPTRCGCRPWSAPGRSRSPRPRPPRPSASTVEVACIGAPAAVRRGRGAARGGRRRGHGRRRGRRRGSGQDPGRDRRRTRAGGGRGRRSRTIRLPAASSPGSRSRPRIRASRP